jgi:hypothetical protein
MYVGLPLCPWPSFGVETAEQILLELGILDFQ